MMGLQEAAAAFIGEVVTALAGEAGRDERQHEAERRLRKEAEETAALYAGRLEDRRIALLRAERERDELWAANERLVRERDDLQMAHGTEQRLRKDAERKLAQVVGQRDGAQARNVALLRERVKDVLDNDGDLLDHARRVRLERAYRWSETPAEGAARLRVE